MRAFILSLLCFGLLTPTAIAQCGPEGCYIPPRASVVTKEKVKSKTITRGPNRAWRYEHAIGYRASVVRVEANETINVWSKGSGVLVKWGSRVVVLTASHVIRNAKRNIYVLFHTGQRVKVKKVLKYDSTWDCAVLDVDVPAGINPAQVAYDSSVYFNKDTRLETAGYGPNNKLAINEGMFMGYMTTSGTVESGPDDWMLVSGYVREGDSGGPVFDNQGRVVGILWGKGKDKPEIICIQPGRIHAILNEILAEELAYIFAQRPTPPQAPLVRVPKGSAEEARAGDRDAMLPWRKDTEAQQDSQDRKINAIIDILDRQARQQPPSRQPDVSVDVAIDKPEPPKESRPFLWLWALVGLGAATFIFYAVQKN